MICEKCGKNNAEIKFKSSVNGEITEKFICTECAAQESFMFGNISDFFGSGGFLTNMFPKFINPPKQQTAKCPSCGSGFDRIRESGKVSCPECYNFFRGELTPNIHRIHGNVTHIGKIPSAQNVKINTKRKIEDLSRRLEKAVSMQDYESAAALRDEIKLLRGEAEKRD